MMIGEARSSIAEKRQWGIVLRDIDGDSLLHEKIDRNFKEFNAQN